ncbi:MAG: hypothetical protein VXW22_02305 [Pseudomonadota bacterium]|nr:hypothetical protein [Pseudomonadota bacterium]
MLKQVLLHAQSEFEPKERSRPCTDVRKLLQILEDRVDVEPVQELPKQPEGAWYTSLRTQNMIDRFRAICDRTYGSEAVK